MVTRRDVLKMGGLAAAVPLLGRGRAYAAAPPPETVTRSGVAFGTGRYDYHSFPVPPGVNRIDVKIVKNGSAATGLGLFDARGSHYATLERPNGFRGIYGEERGQFFVAADAASQAFIPGPMGAGEWTVIVPIFNAPTPVPYTIVVTLSYGPTPPAFVLGADLDVVLDEPGWYRGDLHAHTPESSDAFASGSALTPQQWAAECRRIGLDFLALTDHNVVSQNFSIAADAAAGGGDVLLMAGEEMTNWFHGHATVSGITPGDWFDWRQLPGLRPGASADVRTGSIQEFLAAARASGAFVSVAHPLGATLAWRFFGDAAADPAARTDSLEVWTGPFQPDDEAALRTWDSMLTSGQRIVANGGSDLHGTRNNQGFASGTPTTVVHAAKLSKPAVVAALKAGRSFVTRLPDGVELYLAATADGGQRQITGGTVYGAPTDIVTVTILLRRAGGMTLTIVRDGAAVSRTAITADEQTVTFPTAVGTGGYVRAEVRSVPFVDPARPLASRTDMEAFTNPIFLVLGEPPDGTTADDTQPPAQPGPRRRDPAAPPPVVPELPLAVLAPAAAAALAGAAHRRAVRRGDGGPDGDAVRMTHTEVAFRAATGDSLAGVRIRLVGEVTEVEGRDGVLTRWVPGCCSTDVPVRVRVLDLPDAVSVGDWLDVEASWVPGTGGDGGTPAVTATSATRLEEALPRPEVLS